MRKRLIMLRHRLVQGFRDGSDDEIYLLVAFLTIYFVMLGVGYRGYFETLALKAAVGG